jgi:hypothetical protein
MEASPAGGGADQFYPAAGFTYETFGGAGTHTLDIRFRSENGIATARISEAKLEFWRVS